MKEKMKNDTCKGRRISLIDKLGLNNPSVITIFSSKISLGNKS